MEDKPNILWLADWLEDQYDPTHNQAQAADALRRLARVEEQRDELLEALRDMVSDHASLSAATLAFARAAIAKAED